MPRHNPTDARGWHIVGDDAPYGQARTVCGIDATLPRAIRELADECGHALRNFFAERGVLEVELNGANDNPLVDADADLDDAIASGAIGNRREVLVERALGVHATN